MQERMTGEAHGPDPIIRAAVSALVTVFCLPAVALPLAQAFGSFAYLFDGSSHSLLVNTLLLLGVIGGQLSVVFTPASVVAAIVGRGEDGWAIWNWMCALAAICGSLYYWLGHTTLLM